MVNNLIVRRMNMDRNKEIFEESKKYMPGGVNSPVRSFGSVGINPPVIKSGKGAMMWAWGRKIDEFGTLHHLQLLEDKPDFQIMTVVFGEPISRIDRSVFEDVATWGVCSLQGWVNSYESVRFVAIDDHTAIITGEYNMEQVKVWLEKYTSIKSLKTS